MSRLESQILQYIDENENCTSTEITLKFEADVSLATVKRLLQKFINNGYIIKTGQAKNTKYKKSDTYSILKNINVDQYYKIEIDQRKILKNFNFNLITEILPKVNLFTQTELVTLATNHNIYKTKSNQFTTSEWRNEMERLAIDLSWKSSQIEGNTYTLLETEQLLKEKITATGKTKDEAIMLLNHKEAIDFLVENPNYMYPLTVTKIENLHSILINELAVSKNIRTKRVSISGTNYVPIENEWQIKEALEQMCVLANSKDNVFEKAIIVLLLISYVQPFMDGNKRTARIVSNAILIHFNYCPLSFRTVDSIDYKKAMLLFYEVNNITAFKKLFMEQYEFAVNTYF